MKKAVIIMVTCLIATGVIAQTGLFDLRYAMPLAEADSLLLDMGFFSDPDSTGYWEYTNPWHLYVRSIHLVPDTRCEYLAGWVVCFDTLEAGAELTEQMAVGSLITRHDADFHRSNDSFTWDLSEGRWVISQWDESRKYYLVEYHDSRAIRFEYY